MVLGHEDIEMNLSSSNITIENIDILSLNENFRIIEETFYKVFDLNPCLMVIGKLETGELIDVNQAFIDIIGIQSKYDVIGKITTEEGLKILKKKDRDTIIRSIYDEGEVKNIFVKIKTPSNKKFRGLFSATIIEMNNIKCLLTICQIINKKCLMDCISDFF
mgnify:CR=1 FL=1|jgi:hypothetical protein